MSSIQAGAAIIFALLLLLAGAWLRSRSQALARFYIPASLLAGGLGLAAGGDVLGALARGVAGAGTPLAGGLFPLWVIQVWSSLPELMINVVFAGLFLGARIPGIREMWQVAGPQMAFGQTIAWGQYVVGLVLAIFVLTPVFGLPPIAGALIEISFEGGHGTAAGLKEVFAAFGFPDGVDLALGLATFGVTSAVVTGMILVNWGARRGIISPSQKPEAKAENLRPALSGIDVTVEALEPGSSKGQRIPGPEVIAPLTIVTAFIGASILLGWLFLQLLVQLENALWAGTGILVIRYIPLFPFAMIGGILVQISLDRIALGDLLDRRSVVRVQGLALDLLITTAIATLSLTAIGRHLWSFLLLALAGMGWCLFCFFVLAPHFMRSWWFERAIPEFGQSLGMTASGLLLLQTSDPRGRSPALLGFGYTQLFFEPIVGGGLFTASAIPLIAAFGAPAVLVGTGAMTALWMYLGLFHFNRRTALG